MIVIDWMMMVMMVMMMVMMIMRGVVMIRYFSGAIDFTQTS